MKIALIGYGKMGKTIEKFAVNRGHTITVKIDKDNTNDIFSDAFKSSDVAIEFTMPETAFNNVINSLKMGVSVVSGTTGWLNRLDEAKQLNKEKNLGFVYSSNYSLGVNIFFYLNKKLAEVMKKYPEYKPEIEEIHHIHKMDAPSGTAITLAEEIIAQADGLKKWSLDAEPESLHITSVREGEVPGTHIVSYENDIDTIKITHEAKNRDGLAFGAVIAAEFIYGKQGFYTMKDILGL